MFKKILLIFSLAIVCNSVFACLYDQCSCYGLTRSPETNSYINTLIQQQGGLYFVNPPGIVDSFYSLVKVETNNYARLTLEFKPKQIHYKGFFSNSRRGVYF